MESMSNLDKYLAQNKNKNIVNNQVGMSELDKYLISEKQNKQPNISQSSQPQNPLMNMAVKSAMQTYGDIYGQEEEQRFQEWYAEKAKQFKLNPNPDDPRHFYDYRAAYLAGAEPDPLTGHWDSKYKLPGHPNRYVDGVDTITGKPVADDKLQKPEASDQLQTPKENRFAWDENRGLYYDPQTGKFKPPDFNPAIADATKQSEKQIEAPRFMKPSSIRPAEEGEIIQRKNDEERIEAIWDAKDIVNAQKEGKNLEQYRMDMYQGIPKNPIKLAKKLLYEDEKLKQELGSPIPIKNLEGTELVSALLTNTTKSIMGAGRFMTYGGIKDVLEPALKGDAEGVGEVLMGFVVYPANGIRDALILAEPIVPHNLEKQVERKKRVLHRVGEDPLQIPFSLGMVLGSPHLALRAEKGIFEIDKMMRKPDYVPEFDASQLWQKRELSEPER